MEEWLRHGFGNPSGSHSVARRAKAAVEDARDVIAGWMGVDPSGVIFTSGGTEADNLAILGPLAASGRFPGGPAATGPSAVVVSAVEHAAVLESARAAAAAGCEVRSLAVGPDGVVDLDHLRRLVDRDVAVVSVQTVNQETGVTQPIAEVAHRVRKSAPGAVLHTDAVQAAPWLALPEMTGPADLVSVSSHKIGGPQGIGALGVRPGVEVAAQMHGGGQERERRSGTQNVAAIVGFAAAAAARSADLATRAAQVAARRDLLAALILAEVPDAVVTGAGGRRSPAHCHFRFPGVENEALLFLLDERGVYASAGSACASGAVQPSPVLLAMGVDKAEAASTLRLTLGPTTTDADVHQAAAAVTESLAILRAD
jgi:cysteine desulfurase